MIEVHPIDGNNALVIAKRDIIYVAKNMVNDGDGCVVYMESKDHGLPIAEQYDQIKCDLSEFIEVIDCSARQLLKDEEDLRPCLVNKNHVRQINTLDEDAVSKFRLVLTGDNRLLVDQIPQGLSS